ncbi:hypothetical protein B4U80_12436, partial [Leptotrombidium deliense]
HGIDVLSNRPVGKNLIDHMSVTLRPFQSEAKTPIAAATAFIKSDNQQTIPDIQIFHATFEKVDVAYTILLGAKSRGEIKLRSNNPTDTVIVDPKYLNDDTDKQRLAKGVREHVKIIKSMKTEKSTYTFVPFKWNENCTQYDELSDKHLECVVMYDGYRAHHMVGTAQMGKSDAKSSVVDPTLKAIGATGVRVVDASVMPTIVSANTQCAVMAIAEKAADLIKKEATTQE